MESTESVRHRIVENLGQVRSKIAEAAARAGREAEEITLVAVTKAVTVVETNILIDSGVTDLGENRVQLGLNKISELSGVDVSWHMIGHLQRNKVRKVLEKFNIIHSVDTVRLLEEIDKQAAEIDVVKTIFLQVNTSGEESKYGTTGDEITGLARAAVKARHVDFQGLMTMAPYTTEPEAARPYFRELAIIRDRLENELGVPLPRLSMGMTGDFEVAIEEGATHVRIGTALFK